MTELETREKKPSKIETYGGAFLLFWMVAGLLFGLFGYIRDHRSDYPALARLIGTGNSGSSQENLPEPVNPATEKNDQYFLISRCFFVYAPVLEAAQKVSNVRLLAYGQKRIAWVGGYIQGQKENHQFEAIFNSGLDSNKKSGIAIEQRLMQAIRSDDDQEYNAVLNMARDCDQRLGLPTSDIP